MSSSVTLSSRSLSSSKSPHRSPKQDEITKHKKLIHRWYIEQNNTLKVVQEELRKIGVRATEKQLKTRFEKWKFTKYKKRKTTRSCSSSHTSTAPSVWKHDQPSPGALPATRPFSRGTRNQLLAGISSTPVPEFPLLLEIPFDDHPPLTLTPPTPEHEPPSPAYRKDSTTGVTAFPDPLMGWRPEHPLSMQDLVIGAFLQYYLLELFFTFRKEQRDEYNWENYVNINTPTETALRKHVLTHQRVLEQGTREPINALTRDKLDPLAQAFMRHFDRYSAIGMLTLFANLTDMHLTTLLITSLRDAVLWCPKPPLQLALKNVLNALNNRLKAYGYDMAAFRGEVQRICNAYSEQVEPSLGNHNFMGIFLLTMLSFEGAYDRLRLAEQYIRDRRTATDVQLLEIRYFVAGKRFTTHGPSDPLSELETRVLYEMAQRHLNSCRDSQRAIHYAEMSSYFLAQCEYARSKTDPFLRQLAIDRLDESIELLGEYQWGGEGSPRMLQRRSLANKWRAEAWVLSPPRFRHASPVSRDLKTSHTLF